MRPGVLILLGLVSLSVWAVRMLPELRFSHDTRSLLRADAEADQREAELARRFGSDDILLVAWEAPDGLTPEQFARAASMTKALESLPGLEEIYSVASARVLLPLGGPMPRPINASDFENAATLARAKEALLASPIYVGTICNDKLDVFAAAGTLRPAPAVDRAKTIEQVREIAARHGGTHVAGVSVLAEEATAYAVDDLVTIGTLAFSAALIFLWLLSGSLSLTIVAVAATGLPPLLALATAAALDWPITALGAALFPVLAVVGITSTVHLLNAYENGESPWRASAAVARPVIWSLATTAAAFGALYATDVPAFRAAGLLVGAGVLAAMPMVLLGVPALLELIRPKPRRRFAPRVDPALQSLFQWVAKHPRKIVLGGATVAAVCIPLAWTAPVRVDILQGFAPSSRIAQTYRFLEDRLTATIPVDLVIEAGKDADMHTVLEALREFEQKATKIDGVQSALNLGSLVDYGRTVAPLGEAGSLAFLRTALPHITRRFEHRESGSYRVKVRVMEGSSPDVLAQLENVRRQLSFPNSSLTGLYVRAVDTTEKLVADLVRGTLLMLLVVSIAIGLALRSAKFALAAFLPNLLAPLCVFAGAALLQWPLDVAAVAVAAVAIGLATDDTFHLLHAVAREKGQIEPAMRRVGRALLLSTVVLTVGLGCLLASRFLPTARFGALAACAALVALVADLVLLPATLLLLRRL